jgi:PIN domain nuclease of toxin-antitoxin system
MTKKALLDACTIFGMPIKDTLFTAAFQGVFQLYLSEEILDEVSRNRIKKQLSTSEREEHFQQQVRTAFPQSFIDAPLNLIESMTNDPKDRVYISIASLWEIAIKLSIGKLSLRSNYESSLFQRGYANEASLEPAGINLVPISFTDTVRIVNLPLHHRDPFDKMVPA